MDHKLTLAAAAGALMAITGLSQRIWRKVFRHSTTSAQMAARPDPQLGPNPLIDELAVVQGAISGLKEKQVELQAEIKSLRSAVEIARNALEPFAKYHTARIETFGAMSYLGGDVSTVRHHAVLVRSDWMRAASVYNSLPKESLVRSSQEGLNA